MKRRMTVVLCVVMTLVFWTGCFDKTAKAEDHEVVFGTLTYSSAISGGPVGDSFYYSDKWVLGAPGERNDQLALISAQLAATSDAMETSALLEKLGFSNIERDRFDSIDSMDCAYVTGTKSITTDAGQRSIRVVVFQGHSYGEKGWLQNVTVNPEEGVSTEHAAYAAAAQIFLEDYDRMSQEDNAILWLCGLSRGGAVANVASAYLLEREAAPELVCYTFEAPATTQCEEAHDETYRCIFNYLSDNDPVTMIPMWGMTRFGTEILINTETPSELKSVLMKMNPAAVEYMEQGDFNALNGDVRAFVTSIIEKLLLLVPDRQSYSDVNTLSLQETYTIEYTYQDGLRAVIRLLLSDNKPERDSLQELLYWIPDVAWAYLAEIWVAENNPENSEELLQEAAKKRWNVAGVCMDIMPEGAREIIHRENFYALLQMISPLLVDHSLMTEGWKLPDSTELKDTEFINYAELMTVSSNSSLLILSHQPDVILARMKRLAPAPTFVEYDLKLSDPTSGDRIEKAPDEIRSQMASSPESWLRVENVSWLSSSEDILADQRVYYLDITVASVGHLIPDDFQFTVNGAKPIAQEIRYENGIALIDGIWLFHLGDPMPVSVYFDMAGHGSAPESCTVESGTILRYAPIRLTDPGIIRDEQGTWEFNGWTYESEADWKDAAVIEDIALYASWTRIIDDIALTYRIPCKGDSGDAALRSVSLPDNSPLILDGVYLYNEDTWDEIEEISGAETCLLRLSMKAEEGSRFIYETTEEDETVYTGSLTVNGHKPDYIELMSDIDNGVVSWVLSCEYRFQPEEP